jgi:hypothetical protein
MWRRVDLVCTEVSEDRRFHQDYPGATSQKTAFFIVTALKTSNLTTDNVYISLSKWCCNYTINTTTKRENIRTNISNTQTSTSMQSNRRKKQEITIRLFTRKLVNRATRQQAGNNTKIPSPLQPIDTRCGGFCTTTSQYLNILWTQYFYTFYTFASFKSLTISNDFY